MEKFLVTCVALAIPTSFYVWLVWGIDRFEKEPLPLLLRSFLWGAAPAVVAALILQMLLNEPIAIVLGENSLSTRVAGLASAPITEEILKGVAVAMVYANHRREFDGWVDGLVYGAMAGFGFAYVENVLYLATTANWQDWGTLFVMRSLVFGGLHGFWSGLVGIGFGFARYAKNVASKVIAIATGLLAAIAGHFIHNVAVTFASATDGATFFVALANCLTLLGFIVTLWFVAGYSDKARTIAYLKSEVPDILPARYYQALCTLNPFFFRLRSLEIDSKQQRAFLQVAAELAQKKFQLEKMGEEEGNSIEIWRLREQLQRIARGDR